MNMDYVPRLRNMVEDAYQITRENGRNLIDIQDMLLAIFKDMDRVERISRIRELHLDFCIEI